MRNEELIKEFVIKGYKNTGLPFPTDGLHAYVLNSKEANFITKPINLKYHRWAASLKSSQAFAYNFFSGSKDVQFEFELPVFDRPAQIDVKFEDSLSKTINLYEVKMFEICHKEKIKFEDKYDNPNSDWGLTEDKIKAFIKFKNDVISEFENKSIYGGGIKQLCSHLLGIMKSVERQENKEFKFKLHSFCYDKAISEKFDKDVVAYKNTLDTFKKYVDAFLKDIDMDSRIEFMGFLSATKYIEENKEFLGKENYYYVMKRYFY